MDLIIRGGRLVTPTGVTDGDLVIGAGRFAAVGGEAPPGAEELDAGGMLVTPGLIDTQINGAFGNDFTTDPAAMWQVGEALATHGVTAFLPTILSGSPAIIAAARDAWAEGPGTEGAVPLGLHVEGPMLAGTRRGAHPAGALGPIEPETAQTWSPERGIALVTLAPELPGAQEIVETLTRNGVVVAAGHTDATYEEGCAAIEAGVRHGTHLYNSMPPFHHREPGVTAALLADDRVMVSMIVDAVHVHPGAVRMVWRVKGPERFVLISDAVSALGMTTGKFALGRATITVEDSRVRKEDGTMAGSVMALDEALRNLVDQTGCAPELAARTATQNPAHLLRLADRGRLEAGGHGDAVVWTPEMTVAAAVIGGRVVYRA